MNPASDTAWTRRQIESWDFRVHYGEHLMDQYDSSFGASDSVRAADFMRMAESPEVKAILLYRRGYVAVRTLDFINWKKLKLHPQWLVG